MQITGKLWLIWINTERRLFSKEFSKLWALTSKTKKFAFWEQLLRKIQMILVSLQQCKFAITCFSKELFCRYTSLKQSFLMYSLFYKAHWRDEVAVALERILPKKSKANAKSLVGSPRHIRDSHSNLMGYVQKPEILWSLPKNVATCLYFWWP